MSIEVWIAGTVIVLVSWGFGYSEGWSRGVDWWHRLRARKGVDLCPRCYLAERHREAMPVVCEQRADAASRKEVR